MGQQRDYYEILGVGRGASGAEIRKAYRELARRHHPDVSSDSQAEEKFKEIQEAYEVLNDPQKKAYYDQHGRTTGHAAGGGSSGFSGFGQHQQDFGFGDIFDIFFGGAGGRRGASQAPHKGNDLEYRLKIDFRDAVFGKSVDILIPRSETCTTCKGSGSAPGSSPLVCKVCEGTGQAESVHNTPFGRIVNRRVCHTCGGSGKMITKPCPTCRGDKIVRRRKKINVKIPAGIHERAQLRISREGEAGGNGGPPGDLYISVEVLPDPYFQRDGDDIVCELPISFSQAALGDEVTVPTLDGKAKLRVPPGTQPGTELRLVGKGVPRLHGSGSGDMRVKMHVVVPLKLTEEQKQALRTFHQLCGEEVQEQHANFFDRVRRAFRGE
ncbi:molecular chaperone DnaJ [Pasteuria penetrans]|uniref:molecular chaperone DnaJ n=1 Tax=Pasteuria penetrans TaxID=86005 RepID=UPI0011EBDFCF|nr:molecular chaperone DnaJ [Pasteuria penetrans]